MLPDMYKFRIENQMGAQIDFSSDGANNTFTIDAMGWKRNSSGALVYSTEFEVFADPSADLADGVAAEGAAQDNGTNLYEGLNCYVLLTTDCASAGRLDIYFEHATDAGTDYPSDAADLVEDEDLIHVATIIHPGGSAGSPDTKAINFSVG